MKIYVDFDRTLFDCDKFLDDLYKIVNHYGITKELFKECQNQCKRKGFNPYNILDLVKNKCEFNDEIYLEIDKLMNKAKNYLYPDAKPFLDYLKSQNYQIIILTRGNSDYQREKIFNSHIDSWYNKLIVTMKHKGKLALEYKNSIFIDDNPKEILSIMERKPKKIIYIKRNNAKYKDDILDSNIVIVESLNEIIDKKII